MSPETATVVVPRYLTHAGSVSALGPDAREFFAARGYTLTRLARRNRLSREMLSAFFQGRTVSARLVRNLTKLRTQLEAREGGPAHAQD